MLLISLLLSFGGIGNISKWYKRELKEHPNSTVVLLPNMQSLISKRMYRILVGGCHVHVRLSPVLSVEFHDAT
jgi:hypothetical protein